MSNWLTRIQRTLAGESGAAVDVRKRLLQAQRSRARLELEPLTPTAKIGLVLVSTVEQVLNDVFLVSQPVVGGTVRPLARYEPYRISLATPRGRLTGETRALGRCRIPSGGRGVLFGYRLAMPEALFLINRRREMRMLFEHDLAPEAELHMPNREGPVLGILADISAGGVCLHCRNADASVQRGEHVFIKLQLPEPVGLIHEPAVIVGTGRDKQTRSLIVHLVFREKNKDIDAAMRDTRRSLWRRSA